MKIIILHERAKEEVDLSLDLDEARIKVNSIENLMLRG